MTDLTSRFDPLRQWWQLRAPRERLLLGLAATGVLALCVWQLLHLPLQRWQQQQARQLQQAVSYYQQLQSAQAGINTVLPPPPGQLLERWQQSATAAGLTIAHHQADGNGTVRLELAPAPVAKVLHWLASLPPAERPDQLSLQRSQGQLGVQMEHHAIPPW